MNDRFLSFLISQAVIWIPLLVGYQLHKRDLISESLPKRLYMIILCFIAPAVVGMGIWLLDRSAPGWYWVPIVWMIVITCSTSLSVYFSRRHIPDRARAGALAIMIPLSNVGHTMAGFLTLLILGDKAYPYNAIILWPVILFTFFVWLPIARHMGHGAGEPFFRSFSQILVSSYTFLLVGLLGGTALNLTGVPMVPWLRSALKVLVFCAVVFTMFAMGCRLKLRRLLGYQRYLLWVYLAKFMFHPLAVLLLCLLFGVRGYAAGALIIASAAPQGVNSVALATLYDLDVDLANAGYLWTTFIFMVIVLPLLLLVLQAPLFQP